MNYQKTVCTWLIKSLECAADMGASVATIVNCLTTKSSRLIRQGMTIWIGSFTSRITKTTTKMYQSARFYRTGFKSTKKNLKLLTRSVKCDPIVPMNLTTNCTRNLIVFRSNQRWTIRSGCGIRMPSAASNVNLSSKRKRRCVNSCCIWRKLSRGTPRTKYKRWTSGLWPKRWTTRISLHIWAT